MHGNGIYTSYIPLIAELYAGAMKYKGKWIKCLIKARLDPKFREKGGLTAKISQPALGRNDIHLLFDGAFREDEMQTVVRKTEHLDV